MLIDIHVHSTVSMCSSLSPADIIENGRACGLDGVCITDHDSTAVLSQIEEGFQSNGLLVLVGMEYTTPQGDFLVFGKETLGLPEELLAQEADRALRIPIFSPAVRSLNLANSAAILLYEALRQNELLDN